MKIPEQLRDILLTEELAFVHPLKTKVANLNYGATSDDTAVKLAIVLFQCSIRREINLM